jgi:hypothetical protein
MTETPLIYFLDQITPKPGQAEAFFKAYMEEYAPAAQARGLKLEHTWINPPIWLQGGQSNTLYIVWSVEGVAGYWKVMSAPSALDGSSAFWWRDAEPMIETRSRSVLSDVSNVAGLNNV